MYIVVVVIIALILCFLFSFLNNKNADIQSETLKDINPSFRIDLSESDLQNCIAEASSSELYIYEELLKEYFSLSTDEQVNLMLKSMKEKGFNGNPLVSAQITYNYYVIAKSTELICDQTCLEQGELLDKVGNVIKNPEICGLTKDASYYNYNFGISAGSAYLMLHYVITGKML